MNESASWLREWRSVTYDQVAAVFNHWSTERRVEFLLPQAVVLSYFSEWASVCVFVLYLLTWCHSRMLKLYPSGCGQPRMLGKPVRLSPTDPHSAFHMTLKYTSQAAVKHALYCINGPCTQTHALKGVTSVAWKTVDSRHTDVVKPVIFVLLSHAEPQICSSQESNLSMG